MSICNTVLFSYSEEVISDAENDDNTNEYLHEIDKEENETRKRQRQRRKEKVISDVACWVRVAQGLTRPIGAKDWKTRIGEKTKS